MATIVKESTVEHPDNTAAEPAVETPPPAKTDKPSRPAKTDKPDAGDKADKAEKKDHTDKTAAATGKGRILVSSQPAAEIFVDGRRLGTTIDKHQR